MNDCVKALEQLLEIDEFFTGSFGVKGAGLTVELPAAVLLGCAPETQAIDTIKTKNETLNINDSLSKKEKLEAVAEAVRNCRKCGLCEGRTNAVPGEGNPEARLVFVGEGPGADEDACGRPFVGRAGQLLTKIIASMKLTREDVFICNTVKCRPPQNRDPLPAEKLACAEFLKAQLDIIQPDYIVALGSHAAKGLLKTDTAIGKLRGKFHEYKTAEDAKPIILMPTYHPAYLLRNYSNENRVRVWEDMKMVMRKMGLLED